MCKGCAVTKVETKNISKMVLWSVSFLSILAAVVSFKLPAVIKGPRGYNDRIAIVGAGPAGIHMALSLKQKGFTNIYVLEKDDRIGGKSLSLKYNGFIYEMGSIYLTADYKDTVFPLVNKYTPGDLIKVVESPYYHDAAVHLDGLKKQVPYGEFLILHAKKHFKTNSKLTALNGLLNDINRYLSIRKLLFGDSIETIMSEPTAEVWKNTSGTFLEFIKRNKLESLLPMFHQSISFCGYGSLKHIACLYGLMWNTPALFKVVKKKLLGKSKDSGFFVLKNGFQHLWEEIVSQEKIQVVKKVQIQSVYRTKSNGYKKIYLKLKIANRPMQWNKFDFLIWSPEMKTSVKLLNKNKFPEEILYFQTQKPSFFTTTMIDGVMLKPSLPFAYTSLFYDNADKGREDSIYNNIFSYSQIQQQFNNSLSRSKFPVVRTSVTYQMSISQPFCLDIQHKLKKSLKAIGYKTVDILYSKTWRLFPRYSPADMEKGYLWRVLEMQGKYGVWYIGSSVTFDSVKSVIEYNNLLLDNMEYPTKE